MKANTLLRADKPVLTTPPKIVPRGRPPERMRVTIRQRMRGRDPVEEDVVWPKAWPIPDAGAMVTGKVLAGWVEYVMFDLAAERVIVVLR